MCQRIGRLPIRIIGFGIRWVSSPMRTPRPPQKMTTFTARRPPLRRSRARLEHRRPRDGDDEPRAPLGRVGELLADLAGEVPGQDHDHVRPRLRDPLGRMDRDVRPGRVLALLVRVPVDGVVEEVRPDAAVVEERVALARRPVARRPACPRGEARSAARAARASTRAPPRRTARRSPDRACPARPRGRGASATAARRLDARVGVLQEDAERPAVARELLDVDEREPVRAEDRLDRVEREVREVLVVDRVVLEVLDAVSRGAGTRTSPSRPARAAPRRPRRSR